MTKNTDFQDNSIFQGIKQWTVGSYEYRASYEGGKRWSIFESDGEDFIFQGMISAGNSENCFFLYKKFEEYIME